MVQRKSITPERPPVPDPIHLLRLPSDPGVDSVPHEPPLYRPLIRPPDVLDPTPLLKLVSVRVLYEEMRFMRPPDVFKFLERYDIRTVEINDEHFVSLAALEHRLCEVLGVPLSVLETLAPVHRRLLCTEVRERLSAAAAAMVARRKPMAGVETRRGTKGYKSKRSKRDLSDAQGVWSTGFGPRVRRHTPTARARELSQQDHQEPQDSPAPLEPPAP